MTAPTQITEQISSRLRDAWDKGKASGPASPLSFDELRAAEGQRSLAIRAAIVSAKIIWVMAE
jgi:hypothetical protein